MGAPAGCGALLDAAVQAARVAADELLAETGGILPP